MMINPARLGLISTGTPIAPPTNNTRDPPPPRPSPAVPSPPHVEPPPPPPYTRKHAPIDVPRRPSQPYSIHAPENYIPSPPTSPLGPLRTSLPAPPTNHPPPKPVLFPPSKSAVRSTPALTSPILRTDSYRATPSKPSLVASLAERVSSRTSANTTALGVRRTELQVEELASSEVRGGKPESTELGDLREEAAARNDSTELGELRRENAKLVEEKAGVVEELDRVMEENQMVVQQNAKLEQSNDQLDVLAREGVEAKEELEQKVGQVEEDLAIAIENVDRLRESNEELSSSKAAIEKSFDAATERARYCESEMESFKREARKAEEEALDARQQLRRSETAAAGWKEEVGSMRGEVEALRGKVAELEMSAAGLGKSSNEKELEEIKVQKRAAEHHVHLLEKDGAALRSEKAEFVNQLDKSSKRILYLEKELETLAKERAAGSNIDGVVKECAHLRTKLDASERRCERIEAEKEEAAVSAEREQASLRRELDVKEGAKEYNSRKDRERSAKQLGNARRKRLEDDDLIKDLMAAVELLEKEKQELSSIVGGG